MATDLVLIPFSIRARVRTNYIRNLVTDMVLSQTWQLPDPVSDVLLASLPDLVSCLVLHLVPDGTWPNRSISANRKRKGWRHGRSLKISRGCGYGRVLDSTKNTFPTLTNNTCFEVDCDRQWSESSLCHHVAASLGDTSSCSNRSMPKLDS